MGLLDSGLTRRSLKQSWGERGCAGFIKGSEVMLVSPRMDWRCVQGTEARPDGVWGSRDGLFSSPAG